MFSATNKSRPIPSKTALSLLQQLAYITYGTAAGVGVLYAEDCRRKFQILHAIAENGRIIRQHPRYIGNVAPEMRFTGIEDERFVELLADGSARWKRRRPPVESSTCPPHRTEDQTPTSLSHERHASSHGPGGPSCDLTGRGCRSLNQHNEHDISDEKGHSNTTGMRLNPTVIRPRDTVQRQLQPISYEPQPVHFPEGRVRGVPLRIRYGLGKALTRDPGVLNRRDACMMRDVMHDLKTQAPASPPSPSYSDQVSLKSQCEELMQGPTGDSPDCSAVWDKLFQASLYNRHLLQCARLLQWKARFDGKKCLRSQCQKLIEVCNTSQKYDLLLDLFFRKPLLSNHMLASLDERSRKTLALACATHKLHSEQFQWLYRSLAPPHQEALDDICPSVVLRYSWHTTKNFSEVQKRYQDYLATGGEDRTARVQALERAMAEIAVDANRVEEAVVSIGRLYCASANATADLCTTLAAIAFAKRGDWQSVERLWGRDSQMKKIEYTPDVRKNLDRLFHLYSLCHSAASLWKFVTGLTERFKIPIANSTSKVVLQAFVANHSIALIPMWVDYLRGMGINYTMTPHVATKLLKRYYLENRPPHFLVMWLCRNLTQLAPSLHISAESVLELVEESIGYDLRKGKTPWRQSQALQRLNETQEAHVLKLPPPVPKRGQKLELRPPIPNDERQTPQESSLHRPDHTEASVDSSESQKRAVEHEMLLASSYGDHARVMLLFEQSLSSIGLPLSRKSLQIAVAACLHSRGDAIGAGHLISAARKGGMDVSSALGTFLIHQMRDLDLGNLGNVSRLRMIVIEYYKSSNEKPWATQPHVGISAANALIDNGHVAASREILDLVDRCQSHSQSSFDNIVVMTVKLKACVALNRFDELENVVHTVLRQKIRVSTSFLNELRRGLISASRWDVRSSSLEPTQARRAKPRLIHLSKLCTEVHRQQRSGAAVFGRRLVRCLAYCAEKKRVQTSDLPLSYRFVPYDISRLLWRRYRRRNRRWKPYRRKMPSRRWKPHGHRRTPEAIPTLEARVAV